MERVDTPAECYEKDVESLDEKVFQTLTEGTQNGNKQGATSKL